MNLIEYNNKEGLPTDLSQALQRKYSIKLQFRESSTINFYCLFNKTDINMRFFIPDARDMKLAGFDFSYFKDISDDQFFSKHLELNNIENEKFDIRNQFHKIKDDTKCRIVINETIILGKVKSGKEVYEQSANVYVFKDLLLSDKTNYYTILERQFIDPKIQKKVVRSIGLKLLDVERIKAQNG